MAMTNESKRIGLFFIDPKIVWCRLLASLIPRFRRVDVDIVGPFVSFTWLLALLHYGHAYKLPSAIASVPPSLSLITYCTIMPPFTLALVYLGQGRVSFLEVVSLIGYGLFGHVLTLSASLLIGNEESNTLFFCCLGIFGGPSALRVAISLLAIIPRPVARLLVCSTVATLQLLSLIFLHFAYMHRTFKYGHVSRGK